MSGESITQEHASKVNLVTSGASLANTIFSTGTDVANAYDAQAAPFSLPAGQYHTLGDLVFTGTFAAAPVAGQVVHVYRRDLNIKGTGDAPVPSANNKNLHVGSFLLSTNTTQDIKLPAIPLSKDCEFYFENDSGQTLNAAWTVDLTVFGFAVAS